jgi:BlaI family penicillinase repressor
MKPSMDSVTDAELTVMKALWARGPSTIRELTDDLYPGGGPSHYATVQKLLERLESKSCVKRRARGRVNLYNASRERQDLIAHSLRETADKLCEGSLTPLLTHLVGSVKLSRDQVSELRKLVDRLERRGEE